MKSFLISDCIRVMRISNVLYSRFEIPAIDKFEITSKWSFVNPDIRTWIVIWSNFDRIKHFFRLELVFVNGTGFWRYNSLESLLLYFLLVSRIALILQIRNINNCKKVRLKFKTNIIQWKKFESICKWWQDLHTFKHIFAKSDQIYQIKMSNLANFNKFQCQNLAIFFLNFGIFLQIWNWYF